jgi:putative photosynthetic complex assembly protein 2
MHYVVAICYAIVLWWVSTGLIIVLYRQPRWTYDATFGGLSVVTAICATLMVLLRDDTSLLALYLSFSAGTLIWGWNLASYYTGFITGPSIPLPDILSTSQRFRLAIKSSLYHELMSFVLVIGAIGLSLVSTNHTGSTTIVLFYVLHQLAKLNIFFGVENFQGDWLPEHLKYITRFFGPARIHWFFVVSVAIAASCATWAISHATTASSMAGQVAATFWALLAVAGFLEIVVLMIPAAYLHRILAFLTHLSVAANTKTR